MEQIDGGVTKDRSRLLTHIFTNIARISNEKWINWEGNVLIDEVGKEDSFVGRNLAYKPIVVKDKVNLGELVKVKIESVTSFDLRGTLTNQKHI